MRELEQPVTGKGAIRSIEILRGIAACLVIFSHVARHIDRDTAAPGLITLFQPGHAGVDLFFVLSGFIILHVHRGDIGRPDRLLHYAARRGTRVYPLYWIALFLTVAFSVAGHHPLPSPASLAWWSALLPTTVEPLFAISWTLQYEAAFYVCFGVLILDRRLGLLLFAAWMLVITAFLGAGWPPALCRAFGFEFLFGLLAAEALHRRWWLGRPVLLAGAGAALFALSYGLEASGWMDGFGVLARFTYGIPAALLIVGLAASEQRGRLLLPRWLSPLGRASYSIYLFQFIAIGTLWQAMLATRLAAPIGPWGQFLLLSAAALGGGCLASRLLEQPLLRLFRRRAPLPVPHEALVHT